MVPTERALARVTGFELTTHVLILALILGPVLAVTLPAMLILVAGTMLANLLAPGSAIAGWFAEAATAPLATSLLLSTSIFTITLLVRAARPRATDIKVRPLAGRDGERLTERVAALWSQMAGPVLPVPVVRWFPASDVAAYAAQGSGGPEIYVSAALWRLTISDSPAALAIMAHELAHLRSRDPRLLWWLELGIAAMANVLIYVGTVGLILTILIVAHETHLALASGAGPTQLAALWFQIGGAALSLLILVPFSWLTLKRQSAFITALLEIRADTVAAVWTNGLRNFTQAFASSRHVVHSTRSDLILALLSPRLTHFPEGERLAMLEDPLILATPKLRFFAFSILLVFLLPINFGSPLLWGGVLNYLPMLALVIALNVLLVSMRLVAGRALPQRVLIAQQAKLAFVSCLAMGLPRINLEPISYLAMSWFAGFGGKPLNWSNLWNDSAVTASDVTKRLFGVYLTPAAFASLIIGFGAMHVLSVTSRLPSNLPRRVRTALVGGGVGLATCCGAFDARAEQLVPQFILPVMEFLGESPAIPLLCLPLLVAAMIDAVLVSVTARRLSAW